MQSPEIFELQQWAEQCRAESKRAAERADAVASKAGHAEYLKLADQWLMLARETGRLLA
jgi:hypothetical protein